MNVQPGIIVVLNGAPRSGKSSIAEAIQDSFPGLWIHLGVDVYAGHVTPPRFRPGIGLRPYAERPDLEKQIPSMFAALYESAAAHSRLGINAVLDVGHHDAYSEPLNTLHDSARRLTGLPAVLVGVRCPLETILERRSINQPGREGVYVAPSENEPVPGPVLLWQTEVHRPGIYDLEVDTSLATPAECTEVIRAFLQRGIPRPSAFERLASETEK